MQLYALKPSGELIFSRHARKQYNYTCMECGGILRLREGEQRQHHFYHLTHGHSCTQSSKSASHLQVQLFLLRTLPEGEAELEHRFPSIQRIADVAWPSQKLIFEVQCSPLTKEEMLARMKDYSTCGYQVVWILHDQRYNQWRVSAIEQHLISVPHYYTNINPEGKGFIYDQWSYIDKGLRKSVLSPLPVDLTSPYILKNGRLGFKGDLNSLEEEHPYLLKIEERELALQVKKEGFNFKEFFQKIREAGRAFLTSLLKPHCSD